VVSAVGAVRGAFVSLMGPMGLALAAVAAVGTKLYSVWQESRAAEAAKEAADAADKYQWSLNRAKEAAADLSTASADAYAAALKTAREYFEEANKQLERQFNNTQKIAKANLDLERTKIRNNPALTEEQKIIEDQKLLNNFETQNLQLKINLLTEQKALAEKSKAAADAALAAANAQLAAAKSNTNEGDWLDTAKITQLDARKKEIETLIEQAKADALKYTAVFTGPGSGGGNDPERNAKKTAAETQLKALQKELDDTTKALATESSGATAEDHRKDAIAAATEKQKLATAEAEKYATQLKTINERLEDAQGTETKIAGIEEQRRAADSQGKLAAAQQQTAKQQQADDAKHQAALDKAAATDEKSALDAKRREIDLANNNPDLTKVQRQQIINRLRAEEHTLLGKMIERQKDLLKVELAKAEADQDPQRIAQLKATIASLEAQLATAGAGTPKKQRAITAARDQYDDNHDGTQLNAGEGVEAGIYNAANQLGGVGDNLESLFSGTLMDSVNAIGEGIYGWVTGTQSFGDALRNLGDQVFKELLNTIIRIGAQWLINQLLVKTGMISIKATEDTIRTEQTAKTQAAQAATLPGATANAAATGISSWGVALAFGALAIAMILAAAGAFAEGGAVGGKKQLAWLNDGNDGPEFVMRGAARKKYGDAFMHSVNTGAYDPNDTSNIAAQAMAEAPVASASSPAAALAQARGNAPARAGQSAAAALASAMPKQEPPVVKLYNYASLDDARRAILNHGDFDARINEVLDGSAWKRRG